MSDATPRPPAEERIDPTRQEPTPEVARGDGLPAEVKAKLDQIRQRYPDRKAALIPALHLAQGAWGGWLPDEAVEAVAAELDLPAAEVWGVVSFYDLFHTRPVGRHRLRVCTNLPCQLRGAEEVMELLREELGVGEDQVTPDGLCSYVHFECLGSCDTAPMMMIDDRYEENLTRERVREIVRQMRGLRGEAG